MIDVYISLTPAGFLTCSEETKTVCLVPSGVDVSIRCSQSRTIRAQIADAFSAAVHQTNPPFSLHGVNKASSQRRTHGGRAGPHCLQPFVDVLASVCAVSRAGQHSRLASYLLGRPPSPLDQILKLPLKKEDKKASDGHRKTVYTEDVSLHRRQPALLTFRGRLLRMHSASNTWPTVTPSITAAAAPHNELRKLL